MDPSCVPMLLELPVSEDAVLGGRLRLRQFTHGHRVGHDAVLLAAACPGQPGERAADLGAGVGAAGLALAQRIDGIRVTLVEIDPRIATLDRECPDQRPCRPRERRSAGCALPGARLCGSRAVARFAGPRPDEFRLLMIRNGRGNHQMPDAGSPIRANAGSLQPGSRWPQPCCGHLAH